MFPYCANIVIVKELKLYHCVFDSKNAENEGKVYGDAKSRGNRNTKRVLRILREL